MNQKYATLILKILADKKREVTTTFGKDGEPRRSARNTRKLVDDATPDVREKSISLLGKLLNKYGMSFFGN